MLNCKHYYNDIYLHQCSKNFLIVDKHTLDILSARRYLGSAYHLAVPEIFGALMCFASLCVFEDLNALTNLPESRKTFVGDRKLGLKNIDQKV